MVETPCVLLMHGTARPSTEPIERILASTDLLQRAAFDQSADHPRQSIYVNADPLAFEPPLRDATQCIHGMRMLRQICQNLRFEGVFGSCGAHRSRPPMGLPVEQRLRQARYCMNCRYFAYRHSEDGCKCTRRHSIRKRWTEVNV